MMRTLTDRELLAHIAHAVDPGEARAIEAALAVDAVARGRHRLLEAGVRRHVERDHVFLPRVTPARFELSWQGAAMCAPSSSPTILPGDRVAIRVRPSTAAADVRPVVFHEHSGQAEVIYPLTEEEWVPLDVFPAALEGNAYDIEVLATDSGEHRYVVALVEDPRLVDWTLGDERWRVVRDAMEDGRLAASDVRVLVEGER